ncbi:MAG: ATP-binding protein [Anaerolineae bacterium]
MTRVVVASGKGGTGKTTVATSLALSLVRERHSGAGAAQKPKAPLFLDCDVEAPNAHLFLAPTFERREEVGILIPEVDESRCTFCGRCAEVCQFHAIAVIGHKVLVFPELCHGCGSCALNCPERAISEQLDVMGILQAGPTPSGLYFARGVMNVGEPMAVPIIRQLKKWISAAAGQPVIIDAPPGTSCPVVESLSGADFALLVTEPTPFGLHDLRLMVEVVRELSIPAGVIINRDGIGDTGVDQFCAEVGLPLLMRIPLEREIGAAIARGQPLIAVRPEYRQRFRDLYRHIQELTGEATHGTN